MKLCQRLWLSNKLTYILSILLWKTTQAQAQAHKFKTRNLCIHQRGLLVCVRMRAQAHIYIYTHKRTSAPNTHGHTQKCTYTSIQVCALTHIHRCAHAHTHGCAHTAQAHTSALSCVYTQRRGEHRYAYAQRRSQRRSHG